MKSATLVVLFAVAVSTAIGEETGTAKVVPQPRPRLDRTMLAKAEKLVQQRETGSESTVVMAPVVVTERALPPEPEKDAEPKGKFTPFGGGLFLERDLNGIGVEIGIRPYIDLMESKFSPQRQRVDWELLRIKWK